MSIKVSDTWRDEIKEEIHRSIDEHPTWIFQEVKIDQHVKEEFFVQDLAGIGEGIKKGLRKNIAWKLIGYVGHREDPIFLNFRLQIKICDKGYTNSIEAFFDYGVRSIDKLRWLTVVVTRCKERGWSDEGILERILERIKGVQL